MPSVQKQRKERQRTSIERAIFIVCAKAALHACQHTLHAPYVICAVFVVASLAVARDAGGRVDRNGPSSVVLSLHHFCSILRAKLVVDVSTANSGERSFPLS